MDKLKFTKLKENTCHGDFILPFSIYKGTISTSFPSIAVHWHEEVEVIIVIDGSCDYRIDLDKFTINKGDIQIVSPQALHSFNLIPENTMTWVSFVFNINMLKSSDTDGTLLKYIAPILNHEHELPYLINKNNSCYNKILSLIEYILLFFTDIGILYILNNLYIGSLYSLDIISFILLILIFLLIRLHILSITNKTSSSI